MSEQNNTSKGGLSQLVVATLVGYAALIIIQLWFAPMTGEVFVKLSATILVILAVVGVVALTRKTGTNNK